eukprot:TRINITY_DN7262_c0_g3_i2.p4 TRINITY_DN7262_c0_g3~~TRINITY_DN7262_c0_g3_i2.p4  ORF type:complete len:119 (+),score=4.92 TRINITY_DN7262_c0_g3_i2:1065-1421(+)
MILIATHDVITHESSLKRGASSQKFKEEEWYKQILKLVSSIPTAPEQATKTTIKKATGKTNERSIRLSARADDSRRAGWGLRFRLYLSCIILFLSLPNPLDTAGVVSSTAISNIVGLS